MIIDTRLRDSQMLKGLKSFLAKDGQTKNLDKITALFKIKLKNKEM